MLFNSIHFLIFFPIVVVFYFLISNKYRWILLLLSSYYFYMSWNPNYTILIFTSTIITYLSGIFIGNTDDKSKKKIYLILSLTSNLLILFIFKYFNFSINSLNLLFNKVDLNLEFSNLKILLPVGISFYTFQALSYSMDVYRGKIKPERHFGIYALYVSFFPQLVAGPIERSEHLLPQFKQNFKLDYNRMSDGLKLMLWGYFKKIVIADRLSIIVNHVYNNVSENNGITLIIATVFFGIQIYCDFSAYSDIAIGASQVMGYDLMDNFKRPYYSKSISEFWRRWHISLSTWFKDYLYIPLGGNRVSKLRHYFNLFITFVISGVWHGASWNFVIWGSLHGFYLVFSQITNNFRENIIEIIGLNKFPKLKKIIQVTIVYILVHFAWIFFRANNLNDAFQIIRGIFLVGNQLLSISLFKDTLHQLGSTRYELYITLASILILELFHLIQRHGSIRHMLKSKPIWFRWGIYYLLIIFILVFGEYSTSNFLYFQF